MASDICNKPLGDETKQIINLLPPLPSIQRLVNVILQKVNDVKSKYTAKIEEFVAQFTLGCPTPEELDRIITLRNRAVDNLTKLFNSVNRIADNIAGISNFLTLVLTVVKIAQTAISALGLAQVIIPFIPNPVLVKINAATEIAQGLIDKVRYKADGDARLVPIVNGIIAANVAIQLFVSALRDLICKLEALDPQILDCAQQQQERRLSLAQERVDKASRDLEQAQRELNQAGGDGSTRGGRDGSTREDLLKKAIQNLDAARSNLNKVKSGEDIALVPVSPSIVSFVEEAINENENSTIETTYRGFVFEIEKVPFSPTVNRSRANALNKDGIVMLSSELSFTKEPSILIEELKFVIDRDNLRAD